MITLNTTVFRKLLGSWLEKTESDSLMIEKNGQQFAMIFNANLGAKLVLNAYSTGALSRKDTMNLLGFSWFGQLMEVMCVASIPMPAPSEGYITKMSEDVVKLLSEN